MDSLRRSISRRMLWPALAVGAMLGVGARLTLDALLAGALHAPNYASTVVANLLGTLFLFGLTARRQRSTSTAAAPRSAGRAGMRPTISEHAWLLWATGFCGSLTTYSALALAATHASSGYPLPPSWMDEVNAPLPLAFSVAAAMGAVGASLRWQLNAWLTHRFTALYERFALAVSSRGWEGKWEAALQGGAALVPVAGIAVINVVGSGLAGGLARWSQSCVLAGVEPGAVALLWLLVGAGVLGAFTTFSTAVVDAWALARRGYPRCAALVFIGVWLCAWVACAIGWQIAGISACGAM